jgi:DNA-binding NtrC family response regulator
VPAWLLTVNGEVGEGLALLRQLERLGHRSMLTATPTGALELLEQHGYDLVLIEARMLETGGRDVIAARTPVIVTHAREDSHVVCDWLKSGAADYLPPGACLTRLSTRIDAALAARQGKDFQADYREQVDRVLAAAAAAGRGGTVSPDSLADFFARAGPWAGLARAYLSLAAENHGLRARAMRARGPSGP